MRQVVGCIFLQIYCMSDEVTIEQQEKKVTLWFICCLQIIATLLGNCTWPLLLCAEVFCWLHRASPLMISLPMQMKLHGELTNNGEKYGELTNNNNIKNGDVKFYLKCWGHENETCPHQTEGVVWFVQQFAFWTTLWYICAFCHLLKPFSCSVVASSRDENDLKVFRPFEFFSFRVWPHNLVTAN